MADDTGWHDDRATDRTEDRAASRVMALINGGLVEDGGVLPLCHSAGGGMIRTVKGRDYFWKLLPVRLKELSKAYVRKDAWR